MRNVTRAPRWSEDDSPDSDFDTGDRMPRQRHTFELCWLNDSRRLFLTRLVAGPVGNTLIQYGVWIWLRTKTAWLDLIVRKWSLKQNKFKTRQVGKKNHFRQDYSQKTENWLSFTRTELVLNKNQKLDTENKSENDLEFLINTTDCINEFRIEIDFRIRL